MRYLIYYHDINGESKKCSLCGEDLPDNSARYVQSTYLDKNTFASPVVVKRCSKCISINTTIATKKQVCIDIKKTFRFCYVIKEKWNDDLVKQYRRTKNDIPK